MSVLFTPLTIGDLELNNRIIMAPLTRCRADDLRAPTDIMAKYYTQRASAGLIISEATSICPMGVGYPNTPGIWSEIQTEKWHMVTTKVHQSGGKMFLQLWHVGRISDPIYLDGKTPVSASPIAAEGHISLVRPTRPYVVPRQLELDEIKEIIDAYRQAALNAKIAGFDGVEIHGANGYLLDQFLQDSTNKRTDQYGGSLENRSRLMLEVTDTVIDIWGASRVGMHLAPRCDAHSMGDSNPEHTFTYIAKKLGERKIGFICSRAALKDDNLAAKLKNAFGGIYIINQMLNKSDAEESINNGIANAAAFGQLFIANPDLVSRFRNNNPLNQVKADLFYTGGEEGYTDYPCFKDI